MDPLIYERPDGTKILSYVQLIKAIKTAAGKGNLKRFVEAKKLGERILDEVNCELQKKDRNGLLTHERFDHLNPEGEFFACTNQEAWNILKKVLKDDQIFQDTIDYILSRE